MPKQVTPQEAFKNLAFAVCQQWVYDGKPRNGEEIVKHYALHLLSMSKDATWYRQGTLHKPGGNSDNEN